MGIPTLNNLRAGAQDSLARFPFVLFAALATAVAGNILVDNGDDGNWIKFMLASQLGIALMFAIAVKAEADEWLRPLRLAGVAVGLGALLVYGLTLSDAFRSPTVTRHVQFTIGLHLLVAFIPFTRAGQLNGFWQYNRALFLRLCLAAVYSAVLFFGLSIAFVAIDKLLGIVVDDDIYARLFIIIATVFNTWIFVGGVPKDIPGLENVTEYTKGLRVFAQYILIPLVVIYLIILTIYLGKIILTREWPSGWIGYLVSSVAIAGILAHLLIHPMRNGDGRQWVRNYSRWYYLGMIPPAAMLLMAIGKRIDQYGVTENRYLLGVLAGWLAVISVYFAVSRTRNIKLIPITLCGLAFVTSFGPWGAFSVSKSSQLNRLTDLLERNDILQEGAVRPVTKDVSFEDRKEISATLTYIVGSHGSGDIARWFDDRWSKIDTSSVKDPRDRRPDSDHTLVRGIMGGMNLEYVSRWEKSEDHGDFHISVQNAPVVVPLAGADVMVRIATNMDKVEFGGISRSISWDDHKQAYLICVESDTLVIEMDDWTDALLTELGRPTGQRTIAFEQALLSAENERVQAAIHLDSINGRSLNKRVSIFQVDGTCFLRWKD